MPLSRPQGVAIVGIYPCGKAQNSPAGAALKARRRTYENGGTPVGARLHLFMHQRHGTG